MRSIIAIIVTIAFGFGIAHAMCPLDPITGQCVDPQLQAEQAAIDAGYQLITPTPTDVDAVSCQAQWHPASSGQPGHWWQACSISATTPLESLSTVCWVSYTVASDGGIRVIGYGCE